MCIRDSANPGGKEERAKPATPQTIQSSAAAYRDPVSYTHLDVYKRQCWCKAIKVLPDYSVVHKQDWFIKERYKPEQMCIRDSI